eukprot:TRINITY_DN13192_c0_g2_i2.p1 TRINITY_DN13192_c0_g2~~TRINITY_DN13192_c0_g2_i2.p1  ORF type:complete len:157 (+),score=29.95 TRINITY_DN13192_c0_g2_i2:123-593(+)
MAATGGGASQYLQHLPSRGYFSTIVPSSTPGGLRVYVCDHDTAPPEEQLIRTDATNILIRALTLKKGRGDQKGKDSKGKGNSEDGKGKRLAEGHSDEKTTAKRANTGSRKEAASSRPSDKELQSYTVEKLKQLLRDKGQPVKGKKDELISRLKRFL